MTVNNFVVEFISAPDTMSAGFDGNGLKARAAGCVVSKQYDSLTGVFTLSGIAQTVGGGYWGKSGESDRWVRATTQTINYRVLLFA